MYSHADRIRAVELYIKLGKRVKATIRQLGHPTKNALRNWYREYQQHQDLRVRSAARAPKFSKAQTQAHDGFANFRAGPAKTAHCVHSALEEAVRSHRPLCLPAASRRSGNDL